jgi:hypothetical protein
MVGTTRKSISVKQATGGRIKRHAEERGLSCAGYLEALVADGLGPVTDAERRAYERGDEPLEKPKTGSAPRVLGTEKPEGDEPFDYIPPIQRW